MKRLIASAVVLFFVTSCATTGQQAKTEGAVGGGAAGAAVGALAGYLIGGSTTSTVIGAVVGGAVGATAGYAYAAQIEKRHKELAGSENDLDARIKFARGVNEDTEEYNRRLKEEVEALGPKIDTLVAKKNQRQIKQGELEKEKQQLTTKVDNANKQLAVAEKELQDLKSFRSQQTRTSGELDAEISKLEKSLAQLKSNTSALASLNQRI